MQALRSASRSAISGSSVPELWVSSPASAAVNSAGVVAWPSSYGVSGVMSFVVNHDGVVYEKDLGPQTSATASAMAKFNPDASWKKSAQ